MANRKPEPWESGAAAPFLWIETAQGNVEVWALGEDRIGVTGTLDYEDVSGRPWSSTFHLRNVDGVRYVEAKTPTYCPTRSRQSCAVPPSAGSGGPKQAPALPAGPPCSTPVSAA
jgi:hypothetical protein